MQNKSILIFIDWFTPGYKAGGPTRSMANLVDHLSDCFDLFIVTRSTDYMEPNPYPSIIPDKWSNYLNNVHVYYCSEKLVNLVFYRRLIGNQHFDSIYINGIFSWKFSILPMIAAKTLKCKRIIIGARGMLAQSALAIKRPKKILFLKIARLSGLYANVRFHATNEKEKAEIIREIGSGVKIFVAENFPKKSRAPYRTIKKMAGGLKLISVARISREKNTLHAIRLLRPLNQIISLDLYGQIYDQNYWKECLSEIAKLPFNVSINYKGVIHPEGIDQLLLNYHFMFLPTKGENFGHAIFESLLVGRPVLISDQTPWLDLEVHKSGKVIPLGNNDRFEKALAELADMDQTEYDQWTKGAWDYANAYLLKGDLKIKYLEMFS